MPFEVQEEHDLVERLNALATYPPFSGIKKPIIVECTLDRLTSIFNQRHIPHNHYVGFLL